VFFSRILAAVCLLVVVGGCSGQKQEIQRIVDAPMRADHILDEEADFKSYATWLMLPAPTGGGGLADPRIKAMEFKQTLQEAVQGEMFAKGYTRIETGMPDLAINFMLAVDAIDPGNVQFPDYQMDLTETEQAKSKMWEQGTLALFFFDTKSGQMIYRTAVQTEVNLDIELPVEESQKRIAKAVKMMLESFPNRQR